MGDWCTGSNRSRILYTGAIQGYNESVIPKPHRQVSLQILIVPVHIVPKPVLVLMIPIWFGLFHRFRQYGLWQRYTELYPTHDLVYTVGVSNYSQDWFYAQVTRLEVT